MINLFNFIGTSYDRERISYYELYACICYCFILFHSQMILLIALKLLMYLENSCILFDRYSYRVLKPLYWFLINKCLSSKIRYGMFILEKEYRYKNRRHCNVSWLSAPVAMSEKRYVLRANAGSFIAYVWPKTGFHSPKFLIIAPFFQRVGYNYR